MTSSAGEHLQCRMHVHGHPPSNEGRGHPQTQHKGKQASPSHFLTHFDLRHQAVLLIHRSLSHRQERVSGGRVLRAAHVCSNACSSVCRGLAHVRQCSQACWSASVGAGADRGKLMLTREFSTEFIQAKQSLAAHAQLKMEGLMHKNTPLTQVRHTCLASRGASHACLHQAFCRITAA